MWQRGRREGCVAAKHDLAKARLAAHGNRRLGFVRRAFVTGTISGAVYQSQDLARLRQRNQQRMIAPGALVGDVHSRFAFTAAKGLFREAFESAAIDAEKIDLLIRGTYELERASRKEREPELVNQLYRLQAFDWGGLHQNSLEKTTVDNYVKKITSYDVLTHKIDNELHNSLRGYVLCSWYNHWTSIIIEDLFRDHRNVLPAIGQVKKIDFFVRNVPFDLKVTYLPEGFIKDKRKEKKLKSELTLLKQGARARKIPYSDDLPDARLLEDRHTN